MLKKFTYGVFAVILTSSSVVAEDFDPIINKKIELIQKQQYLANQQQAQQNKVDVSSFAVDVINLWRKELDIPQTSNEGIEILPYSNP